MEYLKPEMLIVEFESEDVIRTSGPLDPTPTDPDEGFDFV